MKSAEELIAKLEEYNDMETVVAIYKEAITREQEFAELKKYALSKVEEHFNSTGESKGRTDIGTFGMTQPKPKKVLDEVKWGQRLQQKEELRTWIIDIENKTKLIEAEKLECLVEVPGKSVPYIK